MVEQRRGVTGARPDSAGVGIAQNLALIATHDELVSVFLQHVVRLQRYLAVAVG